MSSMESKALIAWVNTFPSVANSGHALDGLQDMADGIIFSEMLGEFLDIQNIRVKHSIQQHQNQQQEEQSWQISVTNLKTVIALIKDSIFASTGDVGNDDDEVRIRMDSYLAREIDCLSIGRDQSEPEIMKLLGFFLSMLGLSVLPNEQIAAEMIERIVQIPHAEYKFYLMQLMQQMMLQFAHRSQSPAAADSSDGLNLASSIMNNSNNNNNDNLADDEDDMELAATKEGGSNIHHQLPQHREEEFETVKAIHLSSPPTARTFFIPQPEKSVSPASYNNNNDPDGKHTEKHTVAENEVLENLRKENEDLQRQVRELIEKNVQTNAADDRTTAEEQAAMSIRFEGQFEREKRKLQEQLRKRDEEIEKLRCEKITLHDEIDLLQSKASQVKTLESKVESYRKKIEELGEFKKKYKEQEEIISKNLERILDLEDALRKRSHLTTSSSSSSLTGLTASMEQLQSENATLKSQLQEVSQESSRNQTKVSQLELELKSLRNLLSERDKELNTLASLGKQSAETNPINHDNSGDVLSTQMHIDVATKVSIMRLQHEASRVQKLEQENQELTERTIKLSAELDSAKQPMTTQASSAIVSEKVLELQRQIVEMERMNESLKKKEKLQKDEFTRKWTEAKEAAEKEQKLIASSLFQMVLENNKLRKRLSRIANSNAVISVVAAGNSTSSMPPSPTASRGWLNQQRNRINPNPK